jgi:hypothetical protein
MMMTLRFGSLAAVFFLAIVPTASGQVSKKPFQRHQLNVERVAPRFPTIPGRTLCVCQVSNPPGDPSGGGDTDIEHTMTGYLNSVIHNHPSGHTTVNMVCAFPFLTPDGTTDTAFCTTFEVIR